MPAARCPTPDARHPTTATPQPTQRTTHNATTCLFVKQVFINGTTTMYQEIALSSDKSPHRKFLRIKANFQNQPHKLRFFKGAHRLEFYGHIHENREKIYFCREQRPSASDTNHSARNRAPRSGANSADPLKKGAAKASQKHTQTANMEGESFDRGDEYTKKRKVAESGSPSLVESVASMLHRSSPLDDLRPPDDTCESIVECYEKNFELAVFPEKVCNQSDINVFVLCESYSYMGKQNLSKTGLIQLMLMLMYATKKYGMVERIPSDATVIRDGTLPSPISWLPDGTAFMISDWNRARKELLPLFGLDGAPRAPSSTVAAEAQSATDASVDIPKQAKLQTFIRRMYRWGFRQFQYRDEKGPGAVASQHQSNNLSELTISLVNDPHFIAFRHPQFRRDQVRLLRDMRIQPSKYSQKTKPALANPAKETTHQEESQSAITGDIFKEKLAIAGGQVKHAICSPSDATKCSIPSAPLANSGTLSDLPFGLKPGKGLSMVFIPSQDVRPPCHVPPVSLFILSEPAGPMESRLTLPVDNSIHTQLTHHLREVARLQRQSDIQAQMTHHLLEAAKLQRRIESEQFSRSESYPGVRTIPVWQPPLVQTAAWAPPVAPAPTQLAATFHYANQELYALEYTFPSFPAH
jgi:HSF-type DNA-binding